MDILTFSTKERLSKRDQQLLIERAKAEGMSPSDLIELAVKKLILITPHPKTEKKGGSK